MRKLFKNILIKYANSLIKTNSNYEYSSIDEIGEALCEYASGISEDNDYEISRLKEKLMVKEEVLREYTVDRNAFFDWQEGIYD